MMVGGLLTPVFLSMLAVWAILGAAAVAACLVREWRDARLRHAVTWLNHSLPRLEPPAVATALEGLIGRLPTIYLIARLADLSLPDATAAAICAFLTGRSRAQLVAWASAMSVRLTARRTQALRVLACARDSEAVPLLERALTDADGQVAATLLGSFPDRRAAAALVTALRAGRLQPSRIAAALDRFPLPIPELIAPLTADPKPIVRFWGATLLSRYGSVAGVTDELASLARDENPQVRKAAVETLGTLGVPHASALALALLGDPVWYVRAHAARALGDLGRADLAEPVLELLADRHWWVRQAAKEALAKMGPAVWRDVVKYLDHPDGFARNGAAEVLQNLGVLDSLIVVEATAEHPAPAKIDMLRKIAAAGGMRMTNALLERADPPLARRIRALLDMLGLEAAGV